MGTNFTIDTDRNGRDTFKNGIEIPILAALNFVDSSSLGALISALRAAKARQGELRLYGLKAPVDALFHLVRMHRVFAFFGSLADARKGLQSG